MQNVQILTGIGGCSKYVCKYIAKVNEQNYVVVEVDGVGKSVTKATFFHNTKITSSKIGEDKDRRKDSKKPQGRCISHLKMLHMTLKYPEVVTNLHLIKVSMMPMRFCGGIQINSGKDIEDGAYMRSAIDGFWRGLGLETWRLYTKNQNLMLENLKLSNILVNKVTQFGLRPPELRELFRKLGNYYRWFVISNKIKITNF